MGTFASLQTFGNSYIPDDKKEEFMQKIQKVFYFGGMMHTKYNNFLEKEFILLDKSCEMNEDGLDFAYNYFEDDCWENAGFDKKRCRVYSNKIGWSCFNDVIKAAYILELQYQTGTGYVECNGDIVWGCRHTGWLNYLFKEDNAHNNFDSWNLYAMLCKNNDKYGENQRIIKSTNWYSSNGYGYVSYIEIQCVTHGTNTVFYENESLLKHNDIEENMKIWNNIVRNCILENVNIYFDNSEITHDIQIENLKNIIHCYYRKDEKTADEIISDSQILKEIYAGLKCADSPVILMKKISEMYEKDFWEIYSEFEDEIKRNPFKLDCFGLSSENYYMRKIPSSEFFGISTYKLIPYWSENSDIELDKEIWDWFEELKKEYDEVFKSDITMSSELDYIIDLLIYADKNYYNIFAFKDFFKESIKNLNDRRYQTLWKIFDNMLHNPQFKAWGDVIFNSEEEKRRLKTSWSLMSDSLKNNKARVLLQGYLALIDNKELRLKIFGF